MSLTDRVVVRVSADLHAWIGQQAEQEGLDSATWVRSTLTKMMRGNVAHPVGPADSYDTSPALAAIRALEAAEPEPAEPIDIDALVDEGLAAHVGQAEMQDAQEQAHSNGVRTVVRRAPPYSLAAQPGWIK